MPALSQLRLYGQIQKVEDQDDGTIMVHGIASTEQVDSAGEVIRAEAMRAALPDYMVFPALREMHGLSAAGSTVEAEVDDDGVTRIVAHVVDETAIKKIKTKTYRGFSIGGRVTKRNADDRKIIEGITLSEISLVDRPANPGSVLEMWKADGAPSTDDEPTGGDAPNSTEDPMSKKAAAPTPVAEAATDSVEKAIPPTPITPTKLVDVLNDAQASMDTATNTPVAGKRVDVSLPGGSAATEVEVKNPEEAGQASPAPLNATATPAVEHVAPAAATPGKDTRTKKEAAETTEAGAAVAVEPLTETAVEDEDPLTLARAAADGAMKAAAALLNRLNKQANGGISPVLAPGLELRKGLSTVGRLGYLLSELAYILAESKWEEEYEGDNSPVPAQLHSALQAVASAYKSMSDEELAELLAHAGKGVGVEIELAAVAGDLGKALDGVVDADTIAKVAGTTDNDALTKAEGRISLLEGERDELVKTVGGLSETVTTLSQRFEELAATPMPSKTITKAADPALIAVSKEQDTAGQPRGDEIAKATSGPTEDDIRKALESMSEEDRSMLLMKASLSPVNARIVKR